MMEDRMKLGREKGYYGIWTEIESSKPKKPETVYKYERVFDWDYEDAPRFEDTPEVASRKAANRKAKYFYVEDALYKMVHPDGELFFWMNGVDPLKTVA